MESNKIFKVAEEICLSGKDALELAVTAIESGEQASRFEGLDQDEKEGLKNILRGVLNEYRHSA